MGEVVWQGQAGQGLVVQVQAGKVQAVQAATPFKRYARQPPPGVEDGADGQVPLVRALRIGPGPFMQVTA
ncbi:hypothetical protein D3C75_697720 [compost metagenome]